eukprot:CAMPEP_0178840860 /NCGR_PEP_ID=MMETSP0746-20121128/14639_1 /TAXON_ID=913974 /ORGANISM="Nitzschia punctata, Strain CCMP561" /LENGTH=562 /DNA_ID=CAMNT_0020504037 /DNA_START=159 /DNA_END=1848 /DNA_ORIENTATION=-
MNYTSARIENPFHVGEVLVQKRLGVHNHVMSYAPKFIRRYMPEQHRDFFESQPFLVVAARDSEQHGNNMWATLLFRDNPTTGSKSNDDTARFVTSPDPTRLLMQAKPLPGDALEGSLLPGSDIGILGIELATRRRNRVNGRLVSTSTQDNKNVLEFKVDQSFGNCPQYIRPRDWWIDNTDHVASPASAAWRSDRLTKEQIHHIETAETVFLATGYRDETEQENADAPRFGNDASHRGGTGFIRLQTNKSDNGLEPQKLLIADYSGNNHYNTIGNLQVDPRMGLTVPLFKTGGMIQVTGTAVVTVWEEEQAQSMFPGAKRVMEYSVKQVVELPPNSLPIRWSSDGDDDDDKDTFQFKSWKKFKKPSMCPNNDNQYYRISVKRDPFGAGSKFLHDHVQVGDILTVRSPAGDFGYKSLSPQQVPQKTLVLISSGIGITPLLSTLHNYVENIRKDNYESSAMADRLYWIYSTTDSSHHPFQEEVERLVGMAKGKVKTHIAYTRPKQHDSGYDSAVRLNSSQINTLIPDLGMDANVFLCGSLNFIEDMRVGLEEIGVPASQIHSEDF